MRNVTVTPWTDDERAKLRAMHKAGRLSQSQMAAALGRSKNSIHRQLTILGLVYNDRPPPVRSPNTHSKAADPRRAGRTTLPPLPSLVNNQE